MPKRIKYEDKVYLYYEAYAGYYEKGHSGIYNKKFLSFRNEQWHSVLNSEVEIIEEDERIEELNLLLYSQNEIQKIDMIENKINELIRKVNGLKKEGK